MPANVISRLICDVVILTQGKLRFVKKKVRTKRHALRFMRYLKVRTCKARNYQLTLHSVLRKFLRIREKMHFKIDGSRL